jgi:aspartyl-tRNA(Asn)/glutamyl-tRNA(Gln) amidotransferase subunit C
MTDQITPDVFHHLVELAALEMDEKEAEYLRKQLNNQLKAIHELESISLDSSILPASHGVPYPEKIRARLREDSWQPYPESTSILKQAPETDENYYVVPEIPHTKLE